MSSERALALMVVLAWADGPEVWVRDLPALRMVERDRAVVAWVTQGGAGRGEVEWTRDGLDWERAGSAVRVLAAAETEAGVELYLHRAVMTGLREASEYQYRVKVDGAAVAGEARFATPGGAEVRFLALGDSGDGGAVQAAVARRMSEERADFVIHTGDLAYDSGSFGEFEQHYFRVYAAMMGRVPFYATPGNHDYWWRGGWGYKTLVDWARRGSEAGGAHYSFDWTGIHVAVIDSNAEMEEAGRWLESDLARARGRWLMVVFHHTPYPLAHHLWSAECDGARRVLAPVAERHGVHMVLSGHEHLWARTRALREGVAEDEWGTVYVTTGGGGAALHPAPAVRPGWSAAASSKAHYLRARVEGTAMRVEAVEADGTVMDGFELTAAARVKRVTAGGGLVKIDGRDLAWGPGVEALTVRVNGEAARVVSATREMVVAEGEVRGSARVEVTGPNGTGWGRVSAEKAGPAGVAKQ